MSYMEELLSHCKIAHTTESLTRVVKKYNESGWEFRSLSLTLLSDKISVLPLCVTHRFVTSLTVLWRHSPSCDVTHRPVAAVSIHTIQTVLFFVNPAHPLQDRIYSHGTGVRHFRLRYRGNVTAVHTRRFNFGCRAHFTPIQLSVREILLSSLCKISNNTVHNQQMDNATLRHLSWRKEALKILGGVKFFTNFSCGTGYMQTAQRASSCRQSRCHIRLA